MMLKFFMPMIPPTSTAQMHKVGVRNGKPYFYDPPEVNQTKVKLTDGLISYIPDEPMKGPIKLEVSWQFLEDKKHPAGTYRTNKPDTDNLQKLLKDSMTALRFWKDDALVVDEHVEKIYSKMPGILIRLEELR